MIVEKLRLEGCLSLQPRVFKDERGSFFESFNKRDFKEKTGLDINFIQDNQSVSSKGVLRGFHFQKGNKAQAKLVQVVKGRVLDIIVDIRQESKTFGQYLSFELSEQNKIQLFIPKGFAHGFLALEDDTVFSYKCDEYYCKNSEGGIRSDDPLLNIDWQFPEEEIVLSDKDKSLIFFKDLGK